MTHTPYKIAVYTTSESVFLGIQKHIPKMLGIVEWIKDSKTIAHGASLAFVDGKWPAALPRLFEELTADATYTVLVDDEKHVGEDIPHLLEQGIVDDLLLLPVRAIEVLGKLKHVEHLMHVHQLFSLNSGMKVLIEKFEEDLRCARAIQRTLIPEKFDPVHGLKVAHKYLSGLKSGGDYLDFFEFEDKNHVGILMSDSSGYGLSSAFMSVILRLAVKLSKEEARSPSQTIAKIFEELKITMKPTENLSLFFGILNRKTFNLNYCSVGSITFLHQTPKGKSVETIDRTSKVAALSRASGNALQLKDQVVALSPEDRLVVFTDGFSENFANKTDLEKSLFKAFGDDPIEIINDLTFRVKKKFEDEDDMPEQDCSVMIVDVEKRVMRLAK